MAALVRPSSLPELMKCTGSMLLQSAVPDEDSVAAREGTATHWVAESVLRSYMQPETHIVMSMDVVGKPAPNDIVVTDEMFEAAMVYVDDILEVAGKHGLLSQLHVEEQTDPIIEIHNDCWGTPDCWTYAADIDTVYLWDLKFGHSPVEASQNAQMIAYALHCIRVTGAHTVVIRIVQPRRYDGLGPIREWTVTADELLYLGREWIAPRVLEAMNIGAMCVTGSHCRHCDAAGICPALRQVSGSVVDVIESLSVDDPSDEQLAYELTLLDRASDLIKARKEAAEALLDHRLRSGVRVPGWSMQQSFGHNAWNDPTSVISMGELFGVDLRNDKPVSPAEAKRRLKAAGIDASVIEGVYSKPLRGMKPKLDDGALARSIFKR